MRRPAAEKISLPYWFHGIEAPVTASMLLALSRLSTLTLSAQLTHTVSPAFMMVSSGAKFVTAVFLMLR